MRERVVITGIGCISSFGVGHQPFAEALRVGTSGIRPITAFDTTCCRSHLAATIRGFDPTAFIAPLKLRRVDEVGRLALVCGRLAIDDAGWPARPEGSDQIGVALGTYTAGLDSTVAYLRGLAKDGAAGVPALLFSNTVSNAPASLCAIEFGLRGPNVTFNQREASSLAALMFAAGAIRDGRVSAILTGGVDRLEEMFFKVQDRFRATSPKRAGGEEAARPFDRRRNGFILGEGGCVLLIESSSSATRRGARVYGEILGVGATASRAAINAWPGDPAGPARAMQLALDDAGLSAENVDVVFAAANGSVDLDGIEATAIATTFGTRRVPVASLKGAIGESGVVGAAGLIAGLLSLSSGVVPPTVGWNEPDPGCDVSVSRTPRAASGDVFLVNSIASGGTNLALVVRVLGAGRARSNQL
jgi:3-oxoacyl-[acyl-carrier-protein] synthase II